MHSKRNHKQNEKTTHEMGENICKTCDWQGINLQNIQTAHTAEYPRSNTHTHTHKSEDVNRHFYKESIQMTKDT